MSTMRMTLAGLTAVGLTLGTAACSTGHSGSKGVPDHPAPPPGPSNHLIATSWLSPDEGWVLAVRPCKSADNCAELLHTTDGGGRWQRVATDNGEEGPQTVLRAATGSDLYKVVDQPGGTGSNGFSSTDGGRTWTADPGDGKPGDSVTTYDLAARGGTVIRAVNTLCPGAGGCGNEIQTAGTGSTAWQTVLGPLTDSGSYRAGQVLWQNDRIAYAALPGADKNAGSALFRSLDGAKSWSPLPDPCTTNTGHAVRLATGPGDQLAVLCERSTDAGYAQFLALSADDGATWQAHQAAPTDHWLSYGIALTSTAVLSLTDTGIDKSTDGGASWQHVDAVHFQPAPDPSLKLSGFNGSDAGEIVDQNSNTMAVTTDGGRNWAQLTVTAG